MKLYSYVVARDFGFAPNPFFQVCTLATCKPVIRKTAEVGDWVVGTGSKGNHREGHLVFAMKVSEILSYDQYWSDSRFAAKKPNLRGSLKQAFGDNIYHRGSNGKWIQENSHHSLADGRANPANINHDTQTPKVLVGVEFAYWGCAGPKIPGRFNASRALRFHKCNFPQTLTASFVVWIQSLGDVGYVGLPTEFTK